MGDGYVTTRDLPAMVHGGVGKAINIQHSAVTHYVQRLRQSRPAANPADIIAALERHYLATVTGAGAALGGAAAVPGAGTGVALVFSAGETALFFEATALFTMAVAEVHALQGEEAEHRRTLVLTVVLGDGGTVEVEKASGRGGELWGKLLADLIPLSTVSSINKALCHWFVHQYPRSRGARVVGKVLPFGIGALIGAASNHAFGRMVVSASRRVFGTAPASFTEDSDLAPEHHREVVSAAAVPSPRPAPGSADEVTIGWREVPVRAEPEEPAEAAGPTEPTEPPGREQQRGPEQQAAPETSDSPVTGKYRPLYEYLISQETDRVESTFAELAALVTGGLPKSASTTKSWWGNSGSSRQAKAWLTAGFDVAEVDLAAKTVRFARRGSAS